MTLARIITRSHQNCRELAIDLLARGYAVEIVSPDAIPDNFADLELRVDSDTLKDLTASVAAHDSGHSAAFDFVHHLRAPMEDFVRRPPITSTGAKARVGPMPVEPMPGPPRTADVVARALPPLPATPPPPPVSSLPEKAEKKESAPQITAPPAVVLPVRERARRPRSGVTVIFHRSKPKPKPKIGTFKRSSRWFLGTSAGFALVVAFSGLLMMGIQGADPLVQSAAAGSQTAAPAQNVSSHAAPADHKAATVEEKSSAKIQRDGEKPALISAAPKEQRLQARARVESPTTQDLKSGDAVYRDKPTTPAASRHRKPRHQNDDMVATDTVTYLDKKLAPKNRAR